MFVRAARQARRQVGRFLLEGFFEGGARLASLHPLARPEAHGVERTRDVRYFEGSDPAHLLDIYRPTSDAEGAKLPIVLYVHGGGFRILSKDTHFMMALSFARRGYLVFNVGYRLAPDHPFPAAIEDVCRAFLWVTREAARYGGDLERVVLAGESAGANLVTSLTLATAYERPEPFARAVFEADVRPVAVVPACGLFQVTDPDRIRRRKPKLSPFVADRLHEVSHAYVGAGATPGDFDLADPLLVLERGEAPARPLPPFFLPVGTKDPLLPDTRRMTDALRALKVPVEARYYPGQPHAFHALVSRPAARQCWGDTFRFLDAHVPGMRPSTRVLEPR